MLQRSLIVLLAVLLVPALAAADARVLGTAANGVPSFVTGDLGRIDVGRAGASAKDSLRGILMSHFDAVGDEEMEFLRSRSDAVGNLHLRFQQTYNGLPVVGAQMVLHADKSGNVVRGERRVRPRPRPSLLARRRRRGRASKAPSRRPGSGSRRASTSPSSTYVLAPVGDAFLAWQLRRLPEHRRPPARRDLRRRDDRRCSSPAIRQFYYARSLRDLRLQQRHQLRQPRSRARRTRSIPATTRSTRPTTTPSPPTTTTTPTTAATRINDAGMSPESRGSTTTATTTTPSGTARR